jgi:ABC-type sugar transport system substrate-binding protein
MGSCDGCAIESVPWSFADLGPKLQQKTQQGMLKNPKADYVFGQVDDAIAAGIAAGVKASGRQPKIVGFDCDPNVLKLMKAGQVAACFTATPTWPAYSSADALVRAFAGEEPSSDTGRGLMLVTPTVNFPSDLSKYPEPQIDFRKIYQTAWGVG